MSRSNRLRAINPQDPSALRQIAEWIQVAEGLGDQRNKRPTVTEVEQLIDGRLFAETKPTVPTDIAVRESKGSITLSWATPAYAGHGYTDVWRSDTDQLEHAQSVGRSRGSQFLDSSVVQGEIYYYFLRHVSAPTHGNKAGQFTTGYVATADVEALYLDAITGAVGGGSTVNQSIDLSAGNSRIMITARGYGGSYYNGTGTEGHKSSVSFQMDGSGIGGGSCIDLTTSLTGPAGERRAIHILDAAATLSPTPGPHTFSITNNAELGGGFTIQYSILVLKS